MVSASAPTTTPRSRSRSQIVDLHPFLVGQQVNCSPTRTFQITNAVVTTGLKVLSRNMTHIVSQLTLSARVLPRCSDQVELKETKRHALLWMPSSWLLRRALAEVLPETLSRRVAETEY